jgi:hypothetical protein
MVKHVIVKEIAQMEFALAKLIMLDKPALAKKLMLLLLAQLLHQPLLA